MVADHLSTIHGESSVMVAKEAVKDLSYMYQLLRPIPSALTTLVKHVQEHIKSRGLQTISCLKGDNVCSITYMIFSLPLFM